MSDNQKTLKAPIRFKGIGLHTGQMVEMTIEPAEADSGFNFQRTDLEDGPVIPALVANVVDTARGTTIAKGEARISVTEHVLAALYGMGIDNALLKLDGPEVPILDGSAQPFIEGIRSVGIEEQSAKKNYFCIKRNLYYEDEDGYSEMLAVRTPGEEFRVTVMVDYNSPVLGTQHASMYHLEEFETEIASCRTFVFMKELAALAKAGLIKGGDLDNAIVLVEREYSDEEIADILEAIGRPELKSDVKVEGIGVLNTVQLKYENEPARHKLLDIIGDLALVGRPIKGHILAARPGHRSNVEFGKMILEAIKKEEKEPTFDLSKEPVYDINAIEAMLPHRYPFLLIDKIIEITEETIIGVKNVTMNEPFFQGHFPRNPVMPGVLQVEAMAQVGGIFALHDKEDPENYTTYFLKIDKVRFKQKVIPGDTIVFALKLLSPIRRGIVHMNGKAYVNGKVVSESEMMAQVIKDQA
ncbi:MAG: bifunctional UDP-3-O-[3-hydroxymyristoyl] N-acetylglucosamine deacetylase/3-hydroxyacyl-ACP dehydratase [Flavobacteriales bacterium]|nr:bifunctional UDP-3-O-[3-hydroxymyristoyl] N-acetylglucosamine deacetylase/3-hydroxyacyl-ACP dehydratase [Flavobacteriales bacterium]